MSEPVFTSETPPDLARFFEAEARRAPLSAERRLTIFAKLGRSLSLGFALHSASKALVPTEPNASAGVIGRMLSAAVAKPALLASTAFAIGVVSGAGIYASVAPRSETIAAGSFPRVVVTVPIALTAPTPAAPATQAAPAAADKPAPARVSVRLPARLAQPRSDAGAARPLGAQESLAEERALLESARAAVKTSDPAGAIKHLERHAARFPEGQLAEEREALWAQAMFAAGRTGEGDARAERFRQRFPQSVFAPAIDASKRAAEKRTSE